MAKKWSLTRPDRMPGMGDPDRMTVNAPGDTTFVYGGDASGVDKLVQGFGGLLQMAGVRDKTPDNAKNPTNSQAAYDVSSLENPANYNQTNMNNAQNDALLPDTNGFSEDTYLSSGNNNSTQMVTNIQDDRVFNYVNNQVDDFLQRMEDKGVDISGINKEDFINRLGEFAFNTGMAESRGEHSAANPKSTAKGKYQFTDPTVETSKQSLLNYGIDSEYIHGEGSSNTSGEGGISDDPRDWSDEQADMMLYSKLFPAKGSDKYLLDLAQGDDEAAYNLYANIHHTNPDDIHMQDNAANFFELPPDVQFMVNERAANSAYTQSE